MGFSIQKEEVINYPPEALRNFRLSIYEYIDNLNFTKDPKEFVENADAYIEIAKELFLEAGWDGDGEIGLMWIPPFMLRGIEMENLWHGLTIWHVKQHEDGISWILSPVKLPNEHHYVVA